MTTTPKSVGIEKKNLSKYGENMPTYQILLIGPLFLGLGGSQNDISVKTSTLIFKPITKLSLYYDK